ncbi:MAG TPA: NADP-dependent oxidoreductase [Steroidobacteraceae bacterium]|nr:NADP-dependent oxidoreductase [Steroidobacteraceae bacterium]
MTQARAVVLRSRPQGLPRPSDFEVVTHAVADPADGQLAVEVLLCSLDPAMRRWMDEDSYAGSIALGGEIPCTLIGRVMHSRHEAFPAGTLVTGRGTIASHCLLRVDGYTRAIDQDDSLPLTAHLSVLGTSGLTAYNGLLEVGRPVAGETVLVSAAAGSVGSLVGQIAKIVGCRAVGIAGGPAKCELLTSKFGFDAAVDYRGKDADALAVAVREACPSGLDVYFDNVGGACLEAALAAINRRARIVLCGMIGEYNHEGGRSGPRNLWQLVARTATMTGFLNRDYLDDCAAPLLRLRQWIDEGRLTWQVHEQRGLENFHGAFMRLFDGSNAGRLVLRITSPGDHRRG